MPKQEGQKSKLVTLLRILEQRTDENHRLNVPQLVQLLENQGILAERKSIYSDIDTLRSLGYDIQLQRGRGGGYWMASRAFELSELKLLVDAVQSSSVISARTSKRIIHKLEALCSDYEGTQLQRQVYVDGRPKTDSQTLLYSIDALHTAINRGCLVQFRYKGSSAVRTVSPWQLAWENGCYYLIAYQDEKAPPVRHYRVDRMSGVLVLDEPAAGLDPEGRDEILSEVKEYHKKTGTTVLLVSHSMEDIAKYADRVLVMSNKKIAMYDTVENVFARAPELLALGLSVPQVTKIFLKLREMGVDVPADVYTVPYAVKMILEAKKRRDAGESLVLPRVDAKKGGAATC